MNTTIKKKWIKALLSKQYEQTHHTLCRADDDKDRFCCLGVLIDIEYDGYWELGQSRREYWIDECNSTCLPPQFMKQLDISQGQQQHLMAMNDGRSNNLDTKMWDITPQSFKQIATYIDKNL